MARERKRPENRGYPVTKTAVAVLTITITSTISITIGVSPAGIPPSELSSVTRPAGGPT